MDDRRSAPGAIERVASASGSSFFYAFLTLPRARRRALVTVSAYCNAGDDAGDEAADETAARDGISRWRREVEAALAGRAAAPLARELAGVVDEYRVPRDAVFAVIDGVASDVDRTRRFNDWAELAAYCDLVAGAVGRVSLRVFGRDDAEADRYAIVLGRALQLTNILRDLGPDSALGRFYLPLGELARHGVDEAGVLDPNDPRRVPLLDAQAARAAALFDEAAVLATQGGRELTAAEVMRSIYRRLLARVTRSGYPVGPPVATVPRAEKAAIALWTWGRVGVARRAHRTGR